MDEDLEKCVTSDEFSIQLLQNRIVITGDNPIPSFTKSALSGTTDRVLDKSEIEILFLHVPVTPEPSI